MLPQQVHIRKIILTTAAQNGAGKTAAYQLAHAGHSVYASMRAFATDNTSNAEKAKRYCAEKGVDIRALELDVENRHLIAVAVAEIRELKFEKGALNSLVSVALVF